MVLDGITDVMLIALTLEKAGKDPEKCSNLVNMVNAKQVVLILLHLMLHLQPLDELVLAKLALWILYVPMKLLNRHKDVSKDATYVERNCKHNDHEREREHKDLKNSGHSHNFVVFCSKYDFC